MTKQRLHSALGELDVLTRLEVEAALNAQVENAEKTRVKGVEWTRLPPVFTTVTGVAPAILSLGATQAGDPVLGPEEGDIWLVRRLLVTSGSISSGFGTSDNAYYQLYRSSTPSDQQAFSLRFLFDGMQWFPGNGLTTMATPAIPASTAPVQNTANQQMQVTITGGTISAVTVNGVTVGSGPGTYAVPAGAAIALTYSVAPSSWIWAASMTVTSGVVGQRLGVAYQVGNKGAMLLPGEQVYAQILGSVTGVTYSLTGEAIRVPAEMKGKLLV